MKEVSIRKELSVCVRMTNISTSVMIKKISEMCKFHGITATLIAKLWMMIINLQVYICDISVNFRCYHSSVTACNSWYITGIAIAVIAVIAVRRTYE